jgi:DNA polymerase-3 subunit epsilon
VNEAEKDRAAATTWARDLLLRDDWIIMDTETTGLGPAAEIVEIGFIKPQPREHLHPVFEQYGDPYNCWRTYVCPTRPIPADATAIHKIRMDDVADAPTFRELLPMFDVLEKYEVVIYNAEFDTRMIRQSAEAVGVPPPTMPKVTCAMLMLAQYVGQPWHQDGNPGVLGGKYRYHKLVGGGHSALSDCLAVHRTIVRMAEGR